ncbi:hypothetical protein PPL_06953 [Heterostelium album PN500]|uniref:Protein yippee-like n=1 Tax=Heterostelium pallidum (strain ATCC 26659 / Pp 5 / PN500) TaxID=670386 RepID=D3BE00_HETP5|nr:hypothetical protein PPL_06953 [Heterostelium album PN500]EFA80131.1 hypothetical protein PPL_06953 [Heterostelium album PN500]|eukprot:XP_020432251.1 hypothetical protein PPL_06953 [Heterostelium album PN500]
MKQFQGRSGKAYLFASVVNVCLGDPEDRIFNSGEYNVRDVICLSCLSVIGWRYEKSYEDTQTYKEGKYIVEKARINKLCK